MTEIIWKLLHYSCVNLLLFCSSQDNGGNCGYHGNFSSGSFANGDFGYIILNGIFFPAA